MKFIRLLIKSLFNVTAGRAISPKAPPLKTDGSESRPYLVKPISSLIKAFLFLVAGLFIPLLSVAEEWMDKDAEYCIGFTLPRKGAPGFWQLDNYAFPFDLSKGFTVWDEAGKKYRFNFNLRSKLLTLAPSEKDNQKVFIYPNPQALEKVLKNRRYYVAGRYFRDWNWWKDQMPSQAVSIYILSYEPEPKAATPAAVKKVVKKTAVKKAPAKKKAAPKAVSAAKTKEKKTVVKKKTVKKKVAKKKPRPKRLPRVGHLATKDFPADDADFRKIFKYELQQYKYRRSYRDTNFIRPLYWRLKGKYAAYIDARLNIPHPGKYQFALKSNDAAELYVNSRQLLKLGKKQASKDKWIETELVDLSENPVKVETYYRSSMEATSLVIGWRAEEEKDYKFITQKEFNDFNSIQPDDMVSREGQKLPVIKYQKMGYFQNNDDKQFLIDFETSFQAEKIDWRINGKTVDRGKKVTVTFAGEIPENISCVVNDSAPFKIVIPEDELNEQGELLPRDLYVKISAPVIIYDDEVLDLFVEFHSELQIDIKAFIAGESNPETFEAFRYLKPFGRTSNEELFRTRDFVKKYFKLDGGKLKNGAEMEFSIDAPAENADSGDEGFYFDRKTIIFRKLAECPELKVESGCFSDAEGRRVIPVLHRPTLGEKRSWSLLDSLPLILGQESILIISDDFGTDMKFSAQLRKNAEAKGCDLKFEDWNLEGFAADIVGETAKKLKFIRDSRDDMLVIIPSTYPALRGISPRLQQRLLAALVETARANKNIRKIILTTPFPAEKPFAGNRILKLMAENIQHLVTEQEIDFMSLPSFPDEEKTVLIYTHPVNKIKEYADLIIKSETHQE